MGNVGRPTKYREEYCDEIIKFFDVEKKIVKIKTVASAGKAVEVEEEEAPELPTMADFAHSIGVCRDTLHDWCDAHPRFLRAYKKAQELQESLLMSSAFKNRANTVFCLFMLKCNYGWKEESKVEVKSDTPMFQIVPFKSDDD